MVNMSNPLKNEELHRKKSLHFGARVAPLFFLLAGIVLLLFFLPGRSRQRQAMRLQKEMEMLAPRVAALQTALHTTAAHREKREAIELWSGGDRPPMCRVLRSIQENVPAQMKLYHLLAEVEQPEKKGLSHGRLRISGTALGEATVLDARRCLNDALVLRNFCGELRLVSSRRYLGDSWSFAIEGGEAFEGPDR